jgi:hypothetical protein
MEHFYFPKSVYVDAHLDYMNKMDKTPAQMTAYAMQDPAWFVEVVFSHLDGTSYPEMKD